MARRSRRRRPTVLDRWNRWTAANRLKYYTIVFGTIAALGGVVSQRENLLLLYDTIVDRIWWATPHYARENEITRMLTGTIHAQGIYLTTILLRDDRQALKDAQQELATYPDSRSAQILIDELQKKIAERVKTLDDASRYGAE